MHCLPEWYTKRFSSHTHWSTLILLHFSSTWGPLIHIFPWFLQWDKWQTHKFEELINLYNCYWVKKTKEQKKKKITTKKPWYIPIRRCPKWKSRCHPWQSQSSWMTFTEETSYRLRAQNLCTMKNLQVCRDNDTRGEWFSWIIFLFHSTINNVNTGGDLIYKDKTMTMNYQDCTVYNFYFTYQPSFFLLADDALSKESLRVALLITWPFFPLPSSWLFKNQIITEFFLIQTISDEQFYTVTAVFLWQYHELAIIVQ